ncbi:MAG: DUF2007 domain-containing protein [Acidimicrobiia bacterium]
MSELRPSFVLLGRMGDPATARVAAARLDAEGIEVRVHGEALGPYPVTVGQMAVTELWVRDAQLEDARRLMLEFEIDTLEPSAGPVPQGSLRWLRFRVLALAVLLILTALVARALLRVF